MANLTLTVGCGPYDRTEALRSGVVQPEGIDLTYIAIQSPPEIFARMIHKNSFDVSEMSTAVYLTRRAQGNFPFVALPIFPSRVFRHGFIFINTMAGIESPQDLKGKRVGVQEYRQTAAVWIRGLLQHEFGVAPETMRWFEGGVNAPRRPDALMDLRPQEDNVTIEFIPEGRTLSDMLSSGELDCVIGARQPASFGRNPNVARLFPNYREREKEYYRNTGIFPIMHTLVIQEPLYQRHPWIAESLYKAFDQAKAWCLEQMRFSGALRDMLPWLAADIEEMDELMGRDPWPYGLEPNQATLGALAQYLVDQSFIRKPISLEDMFVPIVTSNE